jgi:hypothetical protein
MLHYSAVYRADLNPEATPGSGVLEIGIWLRLSRHAAAAASPAIPRARNLVVTLEIP